MSKLRGKGKRYPEEFKRQIIKEVEETGNATLVARRHDLVPGTVTRWVRESKKENGLIPNYNYSNNINAKSLEEENEQLKKLLGEKDLEIAILKDLLKKTNPQ
ncbi:transposase [Schnuerera ultunensis]|uniref:transposase n=1 Tax=Schnuerera ultunensis TaxID=45497 RepID=UPI001EEE4E5B|nr:transposase [Schnuerera ultunensis]